ncbi:MAG: thioredoxin domain-containing protein [Desulfonatronovibrio sp.]
MQEKNISPDKKFNSLQNESSPYLLQHAANPVDWLPWGEEAFALARKLDRPVFLSIGYSTCHWCHVMAHECFEDPEVADIMNKHLVCVKVDREERPDVDQIYMTACHLTGRPGGWPLSVFMTPDGEPFLITTVIPKFSDLGKTGMKDLVPEIAQIWQSERQKVLNASREITETLKTRFSRKPGKAVDQDLPDRALDHFVGNYDHEHAGFGTRPKFPSPHNILFLLAVHQKKDNAQALNMALKTLDAMRLGGLFDQVGFGFHRYSTDAQWILPHFEKMLYDQAMLVLAYTKGYSITKNKLLRSAALETIEYVRRDLLSPEGGFYSAENADSEGEEGKFYVWTREEIEAVLDPEEFSLARKVFNIRDQGNFQDEATGKYTGSNVLYMSKPLEELAGELDMDYAQLRGQVSEIRKKLFQARSKRVRPSRDEKILCDWNALMVTALCRAASAFDSSKHLDQAGKTADRLLETMQDNEGNLAHSLRKKQDPVPGFLDDYAFMVQALLELHEATRLDFYLHEAVRLNELMLNKFQDPVSKGLFLCQAGDPTIIARPMDAYDGAMPSGNSAALHNLVHLFRLTGEREHLDAARGLITAFSDDLNKMPAGHTWFLTGVMKFEEQGK